MPHAVPKPNHPEHVEEQFRALVDIVRLLRRECPWDREQTHGSISHLLIEEAYETLDTIESCNDQEFQKELGDLLLHIVMHSIIAEERGAFTLRDVIEHVAAKIVRRHPHVFGDVQVSESDQVMQNWELLKRAEGKGSILSGVPRHMPALLRAQRIQEKVARVGFDWKHIAGAWDKVEEELQELRLAAEGNDHRFQAELGDLLFAIVNIARHCGIVAESALQQANDKFVRRFQYIEKHQYEQENQIDELTLEQMDRLWEQAKSQEENR